jgi:hypothetical protein
MLSSANEADVFTVDQPARLRKDVAILRAAGQSAYTGRRDSGCGCCPHLLE